MDYRQISRNEAKTAAVNLVAVSNTNLYVNLEFLSDRYYGFLDGERVKVPLTARFYILKKGEDDGEDNSIEWEDS